MVLLEIGLFKKLVYLTILNLINYSEEVGLFKRLFLSSEYSSLLVLQLFQIKFFLLINAKNLKKSGKNKVYFSAKNFFLIVRMRTNQGSTVLLKTAFCSFFKNSSRRNAIL